MSLGVAQQVETRTMDKAQNSTCAVVFILFADFPPALVGIKISYFVNYFFLFFSEQGSQEMEPQNFLP